MPPPAVAPAVAPAPVVTATPVVTPSPAPAVDLSFIKDRVGLTNYINEHKNFGTLEKFLKNIYDQVVNEQANKNYEYIIGYAFLFYYYQHEQTENIPDNLFVLYINANYTNSISQDTSIKEIKEIIKTVKRKCVEFSKFLLMIYYEKLKQFRFVDDGRKYNAIEIDKTKKLYKINLGYSEGTDLSDANIINYITLNKSIFIDFENLNPSKISYPNKFNFTYKTTATKIYNIEIFYKEGYPKDNIDQNNLIKKLFIYLLFNYEKLRNGDILKHNLIVADKNEIVIKFLQTFCSKINLTDTPIFKLGKSISIPITDLDLIEYIKKKYFKY